MLLTDNLEYSILFEPAMIGGAECNSLKIVTGFTDCERISSHLIALSDGIKDKKYVSGIRISIILGMTRGNSLTKRKHKKICETINRVQNVWGMPKISCRYICEGTEVHSKVYAWGKGNTPLIAFCGSANYSMNAFNRRRESMSPCSPVDAQNYYASLLKDTIDCFDPDLENKMHLSEGTARITEDISDDNLENLNYHEFADKTPIDQIRVSLLKASGDVGYGSGINWGIRPNGYRRNKSEAYIPYNRHDKKPGFFPERLTPGDKHCQLFKVITKEYGAFYMRLAQANEKGIHSADSNALIGKWLRHKLGIPEGQFITKEMLERYGTTSVLFRKYDNGIYVLDFEPQQM